MINMTDQEQMLIKSLVVRTNAIEKTLLESPFREEYIKNHTEWEKKLNTIIGDIYLKNWLEENPEAEK